LSGLVKGHYFELKFLSYTHALGETWA
jgi:hypothetical protein